VAVAAWARGIEEQTTNVRSIFFTLDRKCQAIDIRSTPSSTNLWITCIGIVIRLRLASFTIAIPPSMNVTNWSRFPKAYRTIATMTIRVGSCVGVE
jgi:hypothetical protein